MNRKHIESLHKLKKVSEFFNNFQIEKNKEIYFSPTHTLYYTFPDFASIFLGDRESHIHIYINNENYKHKASHLNIPIFPSGERLLRAYTELMGFFGGNLELIVYDGALISGDEQTIEIGGLTFFDFPYQIDHAQRNIQFKITQESSANSEVEAMQVAIQFRTFMKYIDNSLEGEKYLYLNTMISDKIFYYLDQYYGRKFVGLAGNKSKGKIKGTAKVLHRHQLKVQNQWFNDFNVGDIVIAHSTDVFYMKYIFDSAGIVTENNNLLSHASLISRELDLGLCLGIQNIFLKIFDGDQIEIDSSLGTVEVIKRFWEK